MSCFTTAPARGASDKNREFRPWGALWVDDAVLTTVSGAAAIRPAGWRR
jgi:hypothetical protein